MSTEEYIQSLKDRIGELERENEQLRLEVKEWDMMCGTLHEEMQKLRKRRK